MAVPDQVPFNQYSASGSSDTFAYTFKILGTDQLVVKLAGVVQVSGYTVSGVGNDAGGNVVFSAPPAAATLVELIRTTPATRSTDYAPNGDLREETLDADFDRSYMALQEMQEQVSRTMQLPQGSTGSLDLDDLVPNAYLRVDSLGASISQVLILTPSGSFAVTPFIETLMDDANAAEARMTLGFTGGVSSLVHLGADVFGQLPVANGGTNATTALDGFNNLKQAATETYTGVVELATVTEASTGTDTTRVITPAGLVAAKIQLGTAVTLTTQTTVDFTGIPSWVKRVTVMFSGVSTNGTNNPFLQIGAGSVDTSGYASASTYIAGSPSSAAITNGYLISPTFAAAFTFSGIAIMEKITGNTWVYSFSGARTDSAVGIVAGGTKSLAGALDRVRLTAGGVDQFDAGTINISFE